MKYLLIPAFIAAGATTARAQAEDISSMIATQGLSATEAHLATLTDPDASARFALGGVRFLGAIETALQTRYNTGINDGLAVQSGLPVLRLPLPPNPNADPFTPDVIASMFEEISAELGEALVPLDTITDSDQVGLTINTADIWFDINSNQSRDMGEGMTELVGWVLTPEWGDAPQMQDIAIRFDTADAAWLSAYAHLLSGISETLLAVDPTEAITRVLDSRNAYAELSPLRRDPDEWFSMTEVADFIDLFSMFLWAFDQQVDETHSRAAHAHFLGMIEDNQVFWSRIAAETDNQMEWIPNKTQTSALPIPFPQDLGQTWQAVLADAERLLKGETLMPVWRLGPGYGLNVAEFFQNPPHLDPVGVIQGEVFLPYIEQGPLINDGSLRRFEQLLGGDAGLYMVVLN